MPLIETESLVLKTYNLGEADRIVVLLTRDQGVVRGVAKGAKRLKSKFGSGLEPFSCVRVEYFQKDAVELVSIQKIELLGSNFAAAANPDFLQRFSYLVEVLLVFSPPHDPNETLYRMFKACIDAAASDGDTLLSTGVYFELWMLRLAGYLPDWNRCGQCATAFEPGEETSLRSNSLVCRTCRRAASETVAGNLRDIAAAARKISPTDFAAFTAGSETDLRNLSSILKKLISQAAGREVRGETSLAVNHGVT